MFDGHCTFYCVGIEVKVFVSNVMLVPLVVIRLWQELGLLATPEILPSLLPMVHSHTGAIRLAGAAAIAAVITEYPELVETALESLKDAYKDKLHVRNDAV